MRPVSYRCPAAMLVKRFKQPCVEPIHEIRESDSEDRMVVS